MRDVWCNLDGRKIFGHGTTRVLGKLVLHFHAQCWRDKRCECEALMQTVAGIEAPAAKEVATIARADREAPAATGALPESLERFLATSGFGVDAL